MTMKGKTLLRGHALRHEGRVIGTIAMHNGVGIAYCSCGSHSPVMESTSARKRWHKQHKTEERRKEGSQ